MNEYGDKKNLEIRLGELQRSLRTRKIPFLLLFEGPSAAGRGRLISKIISLFDSRGYNLVTNSVLEDFSEKRLPIQKYWINTPENGRIAIFERTPYDEIVKKYLRGEKISKDICNLLAFERTLAENNTLILKIFLDISKEEQKKRLKKLEDNKDTRWRVTKEDWKQNKNFETYHRAMEKIISASSANFAKWIKIDCEDLKEGKNKLLNIVAYFLEEKLNEKPAKIAIPVQVEEISQSPTDELNLSLSISRDEYEKKMKDLQNELLSLELKAYKKKIPVIIAFEGCDAAGKGGVIKRLTQGLDPRGFEVIPIAAPDENEKRHHYLWRFWKHFPKKGHFAIFDRTWYGRVLVERVEGFCSENDWRRAYQEINEMEEYLSDNGAVIFKFWLHISQEEQLKRFQERQNTDWKNWKISNEDWRNREKWPQYKKAVNEMLIRTNTKFAPWTIVEAENKLFSRIKVISMLVERLKKFLS